MMRSSVIVFLIALFSIVLVQESFSQDTLLFRNPSFESEGWDADPYDPDAPSDTNNWWSAVNQEKCKKCHKKTPAPWKVVKNTPDMQPNCPGDDSWSTLKYYVNMPASDGKTYIGMVVDGDYFESTEEAISQHVGNQHNDTVGVSMKTGKNYKFTIDLAWDPNYALVPGDGVTGNIPMQIWGGMDHNDRKQLLWQSPVINHENWKTYEILFMPTNKWTHVTFAIPFSDPNSTPVYDGNILFDNITPMITGVVETGNPKNGESLILDCFSDTIWGVTDTIADSIKINYYNKSKNVLIIPTDTLWEFESDYSGLLGWDTITVIAIFPTGIDPDTNKIAVYWGDHTSDFDTSSTGLTMQFTDLTEIEFGLATYYWDFGDGKTSTDKNPSNTYSSTGTYTVKEIITYYENCSDTVTKDIYVEYAPDIGNNNLYLDTDGDGKMDQIQLKFNEPLTENKFTGITFEFIWLDNSGAPITITANATDLVLNDSTAVFTIPNTYALMEKMTYVDGSTFGTGVMKFGNKSIAIPMKDAMGPVIKTGQLLQKWGDGNDTLTLSFSEVIPIDSIKGDAFILIKDAAEYNLTLVGGATDLAGNVSYTFVVLDLGVNSPDSGDSVYINPLGSITDNNGVVPHADNEPVKLELIGKVAPIATLTATPGDTTHDKPSIDVILESDSGNTITYTLLDLSDSSVMGPFLVDSNYVKITINGSMILSATADGNNYSPKDSSWTYISILPQLTLKATPGDPDNATLFVMEDTVIISVLLNNAVIDETVLYYLDIGNSGNIPDQSTWDTLGIDKSIIINTNLTIHAVTVSTDYANAQSSWEYEIDLQELNITATPSAEPFYGIGYSLENIKLGINHVNPPEDVSLYWIVSTDSVVDSATLVSTGTLWDSLISPSIVTNDSVDFYYLSAMAVGHGYETAYKVFNYKRQQLPDLVVTPFDANGWKFIDSVDVLIKLIDTENKFTNVKIHYIFDTISLGAQASSSDSAYENPVTVKVDTTIYIKAIATADNAVNSNPFIGHYILSSGVVGAWYKDETAGGIVDTVDGHIDAVTINLSAPVAVKPDSILFISPFDNSETIIAKSSNIYFDPNDHSKILVTLPQPFKYDHGTGSTKIEPANLGKLFGRYYIEEIFAIGDSVAPLIQRASYSPGAFVQEADSVKVMADEIVIIYSEPVKIEGLQSETITPATFYRASEMLDYDMELSFKSSNSDSSVITFTVEGLTVIPVAGDLLRVDFMDTTRDNYQNYQSVEANRHGVIAAVEDRTYPYVINAVTPSNPSIDTIPSVFTAEGNLKGFEKGMLVAVDFYTMVVTDKMTDAAVVIFDQVGNKVATLNEYGSNENIAIDKYVVHDPRDKVLIAMAWNGTNTNGRTVSPGTYLLQLTFKDPGGNSIVETIPVGIAQ